MQRKDSEKIMNRSIKPRLAAAAILSLAAVLLSACAGGVPNFSWAGVAVQGELAYVAHNYFISAVRLTTGQMVWQYPAEADKTATYYSDPLVDSDGNLVVGSFNGSVVKLNAADGTKLWATEGDGQKIIGPVAEGPDGAYYASSETGDLLVIDPEQGKILRRIPLNKASTWGPMAVNGKKIYVATIEHKVLAIDGKTGTIDWTVDVGAAIAGGVNLVDGKLVLGTFADEVIALDVENGDTLWKTPTDGWVWQAPAISDGALYATDLGGILRALALSDGAPLWTAVLTAPAQAGPAVDGGTVFAGESKGMVRAFSAADGMQVWESKLEGSVHGKMLTAAGKLLVVVTGAKYTIAALHPETGAILWTYTEPG
jgi:outer membrane protein assembly factor BamB